MKKRVTGKRKFWLSILLLTIIGLGVGYSYLSQQLTINNTVNYGSMKWNVSFTDVEDVSAEIGIRDEEMLHYIGVEPKESTFVISEDGKSVSVNIDFGTENTLGKLSAGIFTVKNDSSFNVSFNNFNLVYDGPKMESSGNDFVSLANLCWFTSMEDECYEIQEGDIIQAGESRQLLIYTILSNFHYAEDLPKNDFTVSLDYEFEWVEADPK